MTSPSVLAAPCCTCRAPTSGRSRRPRGCRPTRSILDLEDAVAPDAKVEARARVRRRGVGRVRLEGDHHPGQRPRHRVARRRHPGHRRGRPRRRSSCPRSTRSPRSPPSRRRLEAAGAPDHTDDLGDARDADRHAARRGDRVGLRAPHRAGDGHERPGQGAPRRARPRSLSRCSSVCRSACSRPAPPAR